MKPFQGDNIKTRVDKLMKEITPRIGEVCMHQDIAAIADCKYPSNTYRSVMASWRRRLMREHNIDLGTEVGIGYRVLNDNERVGAGVKNFTEATRAMGKAVNRIQRANTDLLDEHHRRQQDHAKRLGDLVEASRLEQKHIAIAARVASLPRPR